MQGIKCAVSLAIVWLGIGASCLLAGELEVSPSGHNFVHRGKTIMLVGDSGTQCIMQNLNMEYRRWIDDCAACGMTAIHIWALVPPRQKQDGSVVETRYGYVYPGATPWKRRTSGLRAFDQLPQWDLTQFDEGSDPTKDYWPRLRDLAAYARDKGLALGIAVFFGWPKHAEPQRNDWVYHPFCAINGGHLTNNNAVQIIESPGKEILGEEWSDSWPRAKKTQWVWERFADKIISDLRPYGNVFYVFMDEHSYPEGNCGNHFLEFFKKRGAFYVDWSRRRVGVDAVYVETESSTARNAMAVKGFKASPARPLLLLEGPPYTFGDPGVRRSMWTFAIGGGHFIFHDDAEQGTDQTGIMGYDPKVTGGKIPRQTYDWLGHLSRFFNERVHDLDAMQPHNELVSGDAAAYCLANPGAEYAVYLPKGGTIRLNIEAALSKTFDVEWWDPRTGKSHNAGRIKGGPAVSFTPPEERKDDRVLHLRAVGQVANLSTPKNPSSIPSAGQVTNLSSFEWQTATPESQGMSSDKLDGMRQELAKRGTKTLLIIRRDRIVYEWYAAGYGRTKPHGTASLAKAIVGGVSLAVAMNDGLIQPDDAASKYVPQWRDDPRKSKILLRHLATHSSGIEDAEEAGKSHTALTGWKGAFWKRDPDPFTIARDQAPVLFEPGSAFAYSNPGMAMLSYAVTASLRNAKERDIRTLLRERIMQPIGAPEEEWSVGYGKTYEVDGLALIANWGGGSYSPNAAARVGRLFLRKGDWQGQQIIRREIVEQVLKDAGAPVPDRSLPEGPRPKSGLCWWVNSDGVWPKAPRDAFAGAGAGNQVLLVVPSLDLIVVRNGSDLEPGNFWGGLEKFLFNPVIAAMEGQGSAKR